MIDKELLLRDLSSRLPYGVKCCIKDNYKISGVLVGIVGENISLFSSRCGTFNINVVKPYLLPLSSMTYEQKEELIEVIHPKDTAILAEILRKKAKGESVNGYGITHHAADWCNKNHFDYRGLIEKGLAIDATNLNIY